MLPASSPSFLQSQIGFSALPDSKMLVTKGWRSGGDMFGCAWCRDLITYIERCTTDWVFLTPAKVIIHNVICVHDTNRPIDMKNKLKIFEIYELHPKRSTSVSQSKKCRESAPARCRSTVANVSQRVLELGHEGNEEWKWFNLRLRLTALTHTDAVGIWVRVCFGLTVPMYTIHVCILYMYVCVDIIYIYTYLRISFVLIDTLLVGCFWYALETERYSGIQTFSCTLSMTYDLLCHRW